MIHRALVLCFGFIFLVIPSVSQNNVDNYKSVQNTVQNYLEGKSDHDVLMIISDGKFSETTPTKAELQNTYKGCEFSYFKLFISADNNAAVFTLKTITAGNETRLHTFVLMKNKKGVWEIRSWHSSH